MSRESVERIALSKNHRYLSKICMPSASSGCIIMANKDNIILRISHIMNNFYLTFSTRLSCQINRIHVLKRRKWTCVALKIWLLAAWGASGVSTVHAQSADQLLTQIKNETVMVGDGDYDQHGAWAEFIIPFANVSTDGAVAVSLGRLYVAAEGANEREIASVKFKSLEPLGSTATGTVTAENGSALASLDQTTVQAHPELSVTSWKYIPANTNETVSVTDIRDGALLAGNGPAELYIRWYVPGNMTDRMLTFRYVAIVAGDSFNITFPKKLKFSPIPDATLSWDFSDNPGKIAVSYAYDNVFKYHVGYKFADSVSGSGEAGDKPSGSIQTDVKNVKSIFSLNTSTSDNASIPPDAYQYTKTQGITVPAYVWPDTLLASYDQKDSIKLTWKAAPVSGTEGTDYIGGDQFEVAYSTDPSFSDETKIFPVGTPDYDPNLQTYTLDHKLRDIEGSAHLYYRLRRTKTKDKWGWKVSRGTDVNITMNTTQVADTAILQDTDEGPEALITWQPFRGVWTSNTKFYLRKTNKTTNATAATIDIDEQTARSGRYIDKNIQYCNEFAYSIAITLGNGFDSPPETPVPGTVLAVNIGTVTKLTASKGYFPDRVELQWHAQGSFDNYLVKRKVYGASGPYLQIANIPGSGATDLVTDDAKGSPGVYYQYIIVGAVACNGEIRYSEITDSAVGYRSPTGNIYGRVTYGNGQAVENAAIRLGSNDDVRLGQSIYLNGNAASYLKIDSLHTPFEDSAFTLEAWIRPDDTHPQSQVIFSRSGQYELGFDAAGQLYFSYRNARVTGDYFKETQAYVHVAGIHTGDSLLLMIDDSVIARVAAPFAAAKDVDKTVYIGRNAGGSNFKGYLDEIRVWNIALRPAEVARNYTLLLSGGEKGLAAYWRFDETISGEFYDISHLGDQYNRNDGIMDPSFVKHQALIPDDDQLSLKAYTDSTGNYLISGIPYSGQGTTYTIVPLFGTHKFNPVSVTRLVSTSSASFNVDFTDESSFPVTGVVYYQNSTVPVPGVQFMIDGKYAQQSDGTLLQSDDAGKFTISVPVGIHEVKAIKNNHVFQLGGRILDRNLQDLNYQSPAGPFTLYDSTTIRFIGRMAGGAVQEAYPLGHALSTNNLGKQLKITLKLSNEAYNLYDGNHTDSTVLVDHRLPARETDSTKLPKTRVVWNQKEVVIYPDSVTGEFEADLIPEKFILQSATATGWNDLSDGKSVSFDFSNKFVTLYSIYSFADSTQNGEGGWDHTTHTDSVAYNDSYQFIKRVTPTLSITQVDGNGKQSPYFGDTAYAYTSLDGTVDTIPVIDPSKSGLSAYRFSYPVFLQNKLYHFKIEAFESYPFYTGTDLNGTGIVGQLPDGKPIVDKVPTQDGFVSLLNTIREGATQADTLSLDSTGTGYYAFTAGLPAILAPGLKDFSASLAYGAASTISWSWLGNPKMQVFDLGEKLSGTDFVTAGPNRIMMVLRDPPGNRSYSFAEEGSSISSITSYTATFDNVNDASAVAHLGSDIITWAGVGAGTIQEINVTADAGLSAHVEEHYTHNDTKETSVTFNSRFQTSDAPAFVGSAADLYVGSSTNITYGKSDNLIIVKRTDLRPSDSIIYQVSPASTSLVVRRQGINFGEKFGTLFAYPQQHIEQVLIPNLISIRNNLLLPPGTSAAAAQQLADNSKQQVYVSKLSSGDPNFGKSNFDSTAFGEKAKSDSFGDGESYKIYFPTGSDYHTDTILTLNQYVQGWQQEIANNEREKLNSTLLQNYSFHAGNPVSYSEQTSFAHTKSSSFNVIVSGSELTQFGGTVLGIGLTLNTNISVGTNQDNSSGSTEGYQSTIGFELAADGVGEYISVDVNKTTGGGMVFLTKGGETECPYEGVDTTKYYKPGTVIGLPTAQMDKPQITVENPVVSNVPATQKASYTLHLTNVSEAAWSTDFVLSYGNTDSIKGASIAVEGLPLAGGINYPMVYGQPITKVLTITKGPDDMDYNNIPIILHSGCQYDPTGYQALIADTVLVSAHFVPSCSDIHVKSPADNWVLNTSSLVNSENGQRYLPITLDQFDMSNSLFDHIELQYKPSAASQWISVTSFYGDSAKFKATEGEKALISNASGINYNLEMSDAAFSDQRYDIRALAVCALSPGNNINTPSNVVSGLKDTYNPRLFGTPEPGNGILGIGGQIRLNFNEPIAAGLLTPANFQVTGIRNGAQGDHTVSVDLDGESDYIETEFEKNISGRNITAEMWVLPDGMANGTVFSHGNINESMELAFTQDNHLAVTIGSKKITSDQPLDYQAGQWAHVALVYDADDSTVSAFYNFKSVIHKASVPAYHGTGKFAFGRSVGEAPDFFAGKIHEARIWTYDMAATTLQVNSLTRFSGGEDGLMAYYPMNEGKDHTIFDKAHGNNATLTGNWSTPPGKAIAYDGTGYVKLSTGAAPVTSGMDYTLGLWFKAKPGQSNATLASSGKGDGTDPEPTGSVNLFYLGFENGLLTFENNGFRVEADGNYLDDQWHYVTLAVSRRANAARLYVDGALIKYFNAQSLGGLAAAYTYLGARAYYTDTDAVSPVIDWNFKGEIDEFRIWNTYLDQSLIAGNSNVRLQGDELGLLAYYPFEQYYTSQGQQQMDTTLRDQKLPFPNAGAPSAELVNAAFTDDKAPMKDRGPVSNLNFDYVVNNDALIINMQEPRQAIDKTLLTFQVKDVADLEGNPLLSPVTWTAFIDQNPLKWSDDELNLSKDVYEPLQFESYIINSGGGNEHFVLDNLPAWLSADVPTGTVPPEGKQKITFTINEGLNVGSYDEIIYMRNDNGETEALPVNLKVDGEIPDWKVNPADFKYTMTVYGKIRLDNIFSDDAGDMLAAFSNGKCIGITHNTFFSGQDLWYAFLTVYGDSLQADNLEFRIWDASTGKTYEGVPSKPVTFQNNGVAGDPDAPVIFDGKEMLLRNINLVKGWNWISFGLSGNYLKSISTALANGSWQSGDIVKHDERGFDQYAINDGWVGTLDGFDNLSLFKLMTNNAQTLSISGTPPDVKEIPIPVNGNRWNYISYLPEVNMTLAEALADYKASPGDEIKSQTGFSMYSDSKGWIGNLTYLEPGKGYMLYRNETTHTEFVYPAISGSLTGHRLAENNESFERLNPDQVPVAGNFSYSDNMTVLAAVSKEFPLMPGDKISAYAGKNLRAEASAIKNHLTGNPSFFFNISGKNEQLIHFEITRNGKVVAETDPVMSYLSNNRIGTLKAPFMLHFGKRAVEMGIYPNPFHDRVTVHASLSPGTHEVQMSVYDVKGKLMASYPKETVDGKYYEATWNGSNGSGIPCGAGIYFIHLLVDKRPHIYKVVKY